MGSPVSASGSENDPLTYGAVELNSNFTLNSSTGQITVASSALLDYEATQSYTATLRVRDGKNSAGNTDSAWDDDISVTIKVGDVNEQPGQSGNVSITVSTADSLTVGWTAALTNGGPAITGDLVQYRIGSNPYGSQQSLEAGATSAMLTRLSANTAYAVQGRARNGETPSGWTGVSGSTTGGVTQPQVPAAPTGLSAAPGFHRITLS